MSINLIKLKSVEDLVLSVEDLSQILGITIESARNTASRYAKSDILIRVARDIYVLKDNFDRMTVNDKLKLANILQPSSYVSFTTALSYHEVSTQIQQNFFESCALVRSKDVNAKGIKFRYYRVRKDLYFGFEKKDGIFLALPEKALLDSLYLMSMGRYSLDLSSLSYNAIDKKRLAKYLKSYPVKTVNLWENIRERINRT